MSFKRNTVFTFSRRLFFINKQKLFATLFLLCLVSSGFCQPFATTSSSFQALRRETGIPYFRNYTPKQYGADPQNWAAVQDARGVMYFGNNSGVLEYDGVSWRLVRVSNGSVVRSLARASDGTIYVGAQREFGYLAPDSIGNLEYVSLLPEVAEAERDFVDVLRVHATSAGIYFQTQNRLFLRSASGMRVWKPENPFHFSFVVEERFFIRQTGIGLMEMVKDSLQLMPEGERFADTRIYAMLPFAPNKILIGTREAGLFLYDGATIAPFATEADAFLSEHQLYHGVALASGEVALATLRGGVITLDQNGNVRQLLDKSAGLRDNNVWFLATDAEQGLWLALNNGLARAEMPSPLSRFDEHSGLLATVEALLRHRGRLYAATHQGFFYLQPASLRAEFRPVAGVANQCWALLSAGNTLFGAASGGVYEIVNDEARLLRASGPAYTLYRSQKDSTVIFIGLEQGLALLRYDARSNKWREAEMLSGIESDVRNIAESANGDMWLGARSRGVMRVNFSEGLSRSPRVENFGARNGLPSAHGWITPIIFAERELFVTEKGLFLFEENHKRFAADTTFGARYADTTRTLGEGAMDRRGNFWLQAGGSNTVLQTGVALRQSNGAYVWSYTPFARLMDFEVHDFYREAAATNDDEVVWFGGPEGVVRYEKSIPQNYAEGFATLLRRIITANDNKTIWAGSGVGAIRDGLATPLPHSRNALRFEFSASSYSGENANLFQYFLEGFDRGWSGWTNETKKDYTNLSEGAYRFRVRARNVYEQVGAQASWRFRISPPWYRAWWAYAFYLVTLGWVIASGVKYRTRQLEERSRELENVVLERTTEIAQQKNNIEWLNQIGKDLTASLDLDVIFYKLYESINQLADATVFGVGIYHEEKHEIEYRLAIEKGKRFAPYSRDTLEKNQFPVWCIENRKPVFINHVRTEYAQYIGSYEEPKLLLEDGSLSEAPVALIYLPLLAQERVLGVLTIQSYQRNAYTLDHLKLLQSLAAYTAIALDNANAYRRLNTTLEHLQATQQQLVVQEKLASLGALTAGIAHEIKNPLNFVNNFAVLSIDLVRELREEMAKAKGEEGGVKMGAEEVENLEELFELLVQNAEKINHHGKRADSIVKSMMEHSRGSMGERECVNINRVLEEAVNLTYHGLRAQNMDFNITIEKDYDSALGEAEVVTQDLSRVFINILNNACYAAYEKQTKAGSGFSPTLFVGTKARGNQIEIRIRDNGTGIPGHVRDQIFNPFFTTKPTGKGTGLGLSISYDIIVQQHKGTIAVESEEGKFTEFVITLPKS